MKGKFFLLLICCAGAKGGNSDQRAKRAKAFRKAGARQRTDETAGRFPAVVSLPAANFQRLEQPVLHSNGEMPLFFKGLCPEM